MSIGAQEVGEGELGAHGNGAVGIGEYAAEVRARVVAKVAEALGRAVDETAPKVAVVRCGEGLYLFTDFHHLVFDGRSYDIFISQLTRILDGKDLAPESYSYFDYARNQQEYKQSEAYAAARDFSQSR